MYSEPRPYAFISCIEAYFLLFVFSEWYSFSHILADNLDWAVYCLAGEMYRRSAVLLYASSYVTWTFQTHTFSNSIEAVLVSCSLVTVIIFKHSRVYQWKNIVLI
jgi:phosphatidylinositol glycan class Z